MSFESYAIQALEALRGEIDTDIDGLQQQLIAGRPSTFDDYKHLCGRIQGLMAARDHLNALAKKVTSDE